MQMLYTRLVNDLMLDCHSGDDLKSPTRKVFGRATHGNIHFKISPSLQVMFGETLGDPFVCWSELLRGGESVR